MRLQWILPAVAVALFAARAFAGAECDGWGEFRGIRIDGELIPFSTSLHAPSPDWKQDAFSATQTISNTRFTRNGDTQTSTASIANNGLSYTQLVQDTAPGVARVTITATANRNLYLAGTYYFVNVPFSAYSGGTVQFLGNATTPANPIDLNERPFGETYATRKAPGILLASPTRKIELDFDAPVEIVIKKDALIETDYAMQDGLRLPVEPKKRELIAIYFPLATGNLTQGQSVKATFTIKASGTIDKTPVQFALDTAHPGPAFDGIGGNFRIQSPQDTAHIQYNMDNLRVAWGRVEMPLAQWQPNENADPASQPLADGPRQAMEMARTLAQKNIPFVISSWSVPNWAYGPSQRKADQPGGIQARRINPEKMQAIYKSIGSYLTYLKKNYNAEPLAFSFNESDLGINILFTPQEHAELIKGLGAYLQSQGLKTRLLLGDACSPHPVKFIDAALNDPECSKYIAAVSFHSWHDGTPEEFAVWGQAARKLNVPLICGEGGTDADAYRYAIIFQEPWFAMNELETYVQIMQYGQATSILHWQLTQDYSVLTGGRGGPLQPTRRFFHLKQLGLTPAGAPFLPLAGEAPNITRAAYGGAAKGYAIHLVNNGATRDATITGLPATLNELRVFVTDAKRQMAEINKVAVADGTVHITLDQGSLTTLTGGK